MDEYTFIAEDPQVEGQIEAAPAIQNVSAEQLYTNELVQELQVISANILTLFGFVDCR